VKIREIGGQKFFEGGNKIISCKFQELFLLLLIDDF